MQRMAPIRMGPVEDQPQIHANLPTSTEAMLSSISPLPAIPSLAPLLCEPLPCLSRRLYRRIGGLKNLNNTRRIHPTIVSIIDQFSQVRLYRLHEGKWQKYAFEGNFFPL
jgi:hypothetical protein